MVDWYSCPKCKKLHAINGDADKKCLTCGGTDGEIISSDRMKEGREAGAYFNFDVGGKPPTSR